MQKPLTEEQMEKIDRRRNKSGWSIKRIAKDLHISDKRVSAYLRGNQKPEAKKDKNPAKNKDAFLTTVKTSIEGASNAISGCADVIYDTILEVICDLFSDKKFTKKELKEKFNKRFDKLADAIGDAAYSTGVAVIFTMPPEFKKLWVESLMRNPKDAAKGKKPKKSNGKSRK